VKLAWKPGMELPFAMWDEMEASYSIPENIIYPPGSSEWHKVYFAHLSGLDSLEEEYKTNPGSISARLRAGAVFPSRPVS